MLFKNFGPNLEKMFFRKFKSEKNTIQNSNTIDKKKVCIHNKSNQINVYYIYVKVEQKSTLISIFSVIPLL